jgi:NADPH:quinone reductase-like Zn-dependent oxidoreductase
MSRDTYKGLALHGYNALSELRWSDVEMPLELNDDQLLVKVEAASVNALDVDMLNGYGKQLFESVRPLPAVLGT